MLPPGKKNYKAIYLAGVRLKPSGSHQNRYEKCALGVASRILNGMPKKLHF